jgi:hypothetical protein
MATRMQQRRGTAAQWISTNSGNGPILNAGEIGWESDTNKFKVGDGVSYWLNLDYFADINSTVNPSFGSSITFEGATANDYETTLAVTDPTADRTITLPNVTGTVITTGNLSDITNIGVFTSSITMEGSSADDFELTLSAGDPTADRTIAFPDSSGTVALVENLVTALGSTYLEPGDIGASEGVVGLNSSLNAIIPGASIIIEGATANDFETTLTVTNPTEDRTITFPDATGTVAILDATQTFTNKTLTSPKINEDVAVTATATELNYVDGVTSAIQTQMDAKAPLASPALTGNATAVNLTISGNLTVDGTTTNINSTNLVVEDKNIVLGDTGTPTDTTADGGGITLKGATDKTLNWVDATDAWTSSEDFNLLTGKVYKIAGTSVLSGTTLGSGVTGSSLTSVGTITSGTWTGTAIAVANGGTGSTSAGDARTALGLAIGTDVQAYNSTLAAVAGGTYTGDDSITTLGTITAGTWTGTTIAIANGGTGQTTAMTAATALLPDQASNSGKYLTTDGSGTLSWGTVSGYSAPTLGSTSIASGATVTTIEGLTLTSPVLTTPSISTIDAVGDLLIGTADNTIGKISIGANGYLLTSNGTTASWQAAAPSGAAFSELMLIGA